MDKPRPYGRGLSLDLIVPMEQQTPNPRPAPPPDILSGNLTPDMTFAQKVWTLTSRIPRGQVTTYREIGDAMNTRAYRAVGMALHNNPYAPAVPCHRVVGSSGRMTGYAHGIAMKQRLLKEEGVPCKKDKVVDLAAHLYHFA